MLGDNKGIVRKNVLFEIIKSGQESELINIDVFPPQIIN
jgi:hypothetical protein